MSTAGSPPGDTGTSQTSLSGSAIRTGEIRGTIRDGPRAQDSGCPNAVASRRMVRELYEAGTRELTLRAALCPAAGNRIAPRKSAGHCLGLNGRRLARATVVGYSVMATAGEPRGDGVGWPLLTQETAWRRHRAGTVPRIRLSHVTQDQLERNNRMTAARARWSLRGCRRAAPKMP